MRRTYRAPRRPKVGLWTGQPYREAGTLDAPPLVVTPLAHEQGNREQKLADDGAVLARIRCTCGWVGCWFESDFAIERSWARHAEHAAKESA